MLLDEKIFEKLVDAVIEQESGGNPKAVSGAGACGLMQLMDQTAEETMRDLGMDPADYEPFNPIQNRYVGSAYLRKMIGLFNDIKLALSAYNAGPGRVHSLIRRYGSTFDAIKPHLPSETQNYVAKISSTLHDGGVIV